MDIQTKTDGDWRRVESEQAVKLMGKRRAATMAAVIGSEELDKLLEESGSEEA